MLTKKFKKILKIPATTYQTLVLKMFMLLELKQEKFDFILYNVIT